MTVMVCILMYIVKCHEQLELQFILSSPQDAQLFPLIFAVPQK